MIYILEGPDGVGKSTLANEIARQTKGHVIHCTWKEDWNMKEYFRDVLRAANELSEYQDVVIDRWAPSESVYGEVFRGGASFDVVEFIKKKMFGRRDVQWIMCKNDNAVANHIKNAKERHEMFDDMTDVVKGFEKFATFTPELNWIEYDYNKVNMKEFVNELVN